MHEHIKIKGRPCLPQRNASEEIQPYGKKAERVSSSFGSEGSDVFSFFFGIDRPILNEDVRENGLFYARRLFRPRTKNKWSIQTFSGFECALCPVTKRWFSWDDQCLIAVRTTETPNLSRRNVLRASGRLSLLYKVSVCNTTFASSPSSGHIWYDENKRAACQ